MANTSDAGKHEFITTAEVEALRTRAARLHAQGKSPRDVLEAMVTDEVRRSYATPAFA